MGCDIHAHTEVKINGVWHHYGTPNISRSYDLFARMAGVRNTSDAIEPISKPRGIPEDATFITKFDNERWDTDGHSHSWLNSEELAELVEWYDAKKKEWNPNEWFSWERHGLGYLFGNGWNVRKYPEDYPKGVEDARIIFWFDN